ncbi:MAG: cyclic nucleotide-binding domain-containing protein [Xanthomonadales bacterium]|nr:cyclic nucleotide-binding domain-containing protein [Xanthomonadales bacterium]
MPYAPIDILKFLDGSHGFVRYSKGKEIFREGEPGDRMFVIVEGEVRLSINGQQLAVEYPGGIVGEMSLIEQADRSATASALTNCVLAPLDLAGFKNLVAREPQFAIQVMQVLSRRLRMANEVLNLY